MPISERSPSRGRQAFQSTGRGGAGNIRLPSSTDARPESGPDDFSLTRGREPIRNPPTEIFSTGRGGAGNIRSPSRDNRKPSMIEEDVINRYKKAQEDAPVSSGRGGLGNISRSRTRESTTIQTVRSTSRGGVRNSVAGNGSGSVAESIQKIKDEEYGRGGNDNTTTKREPPIELHHIGDGYQSTVPGGMGKIVKETT